ncbi:MAG: SpoIIE family protein phosphatase [Anaerolineae bacterium]|nr:SpoIIE family protein phosphatase [Anaerolineae bacterium]
MVQKFIHSLRVGQFVGLNFTVLLVVALLIGLAGLSAYRVSKQQNEIILARHRVERLTLELQMLTLERTNLLRNFLETNDTRQRLAYQSKHTEYVTVYSELANLLRNAEEARALQAVVEVEDAFDQLVNDAFALFDSGDIQEAKALWNREGGSAINRILAATERWNDLQAENNEAIIEQAQRTERLAVWGVTVLVILTLVGGATSTYLITRNITQPISYLVDQTKSIDFDTATQIKPYGPVEIAFLGKSLNSMADRLFQSKQALEASRDQLESELLSASRTQANFLPDSSLTNHGLDVACFWHPARELAGDFYTHVDLGPGRFGLALCDVVGKGASAAMIGSLTLGLMEAQLPHYDRPEALLKAISNKIYHRFKGDNVVVACCYAIIDEQQCTLTVANAGCMFPYLKQHNHLDDIEVVGLPMGAWPDYHYYSKTVALQTNDLLLFSSDGLTEARNHRGDIFGFARLESVLQQIPPHATAQMVIDRLVNRLQAFVGSADVSDDITMIVVRVT